MRESIFKSVDQIEHLLERLPDVRIAVVGDYFLDKYLVIDPALEEVSIETGKPANQVVDIYHSPGAAGTVVNNLCALGIGEVIAVGVIGDDGQGYELRQDLTALGVNQDRLIISNEIFTPTYTKPMRIEGDKRVEQERIDIKNRRPMNQKIEEHLLNVLHELIETVDGIIIADQVEERNFGVITDRVRSEFSQLAARYRDVIVFADSRVRIGEYRNMYIKPNKFEAFRAVNGTEPPEEIGIDEARHLAQTLFLRNKAPVIVTLQEKGALIANPEGVVHVPGIEVEGEIDPVGAGDSFTAGFVGARCAGATDQLAAVMGVIVSSITVQKIGTTGTATPSEVLERSKLVKPMQKK